MKTTIWLLGLILLLNNILYSQTGWNSVNINSTSHLHSIFFPSSNVGYIAGWSSEIIKTTDGGNNWFHLTSNPNMDIQCVFFINNNTGWLSGGAGAIRYTTDGGNSWTSQYSGTSGILYIVYFINSNTGWISGDNGLILKTTNCGQIWNTKFSSSTYNLTFVYFYNENTGWISGDYGTMLKSTNGGENWFSIGPNISNNLGKMFFINALTGWSGTDNGNILKTTNGGLNWTFQQSGTNNWLISPFFVSPNTGWIVGVSGTIMKTTTGGNNWYQQNSGTLNQFRSIYFLNANTGFSVGFFGTVVKTITSGENLVAPILIYPPNQSVNISLTPAMTWNSVNGAINYKIQISTVSNFGIITDSATITDVQYPVPSGKLQHGLTYFWRVSANTNFGVTPWSEIWYFSTQTVGISINYSVVPTEFKLYSNYPNPFNPVTKIKFDVPKASIIKLIIFNTLGKEEETLINENMRTGTYELTWNASKYNSGVYFIRFINEDKSDTKKMILIK